MSKTIIIRNKKTGEIVTLRRKPKKKQEKPIENNKRVGVAGSVSQGEFEGGARNVMGNVFERPAAAVRGAIQGAVSGQGAGAGFMKGAINPGQVPTFQDLALKKSVPQTESVLHNYIVGTVPSALGLAADIATNPASLLMMLVGQTPAGGGTTLGGRVAATKAGQAVTRLANTPIDELAQKVKPDFKVGGRVVNSLIRPRQREYLFGKNPGRGIAKEGIVANSMDDLSSKVDARLSQLNEAAKTIRSTPENLGKTVDLRGIEKPLLNSLEQLNKAPETNAAQISSIRKALADLKQFKYGNIKRVPTSRAYDIKRTIADMQQWTTETKQGHNVNKSLKQIYGFVDKKLDGAIPELTQINSRIADMISAKQAIMHRINVLQSQEVSGAMQFINMPFAIAKSPGAKTLLGKLLSKQYAKLQTQASSKLIK